MKDPRHRPRPLNAVRPPPPPVPPAAPNVGTSSTQEAARRIAEAPRAWAVKYPSRPIRPDECFLTRAFADQIARRDGATVVRIALVELRPKEAE
jgi:hypothetical protein